MATYGGAGILAVAQATGLSRQTTYRIKGDPSATEATLATRAAWSPSNTTTRVMFVTAPALSMGEISIVGGKLCRSWNEGWSMIAALPNPFIDLPLTPLEDQIENIRLKLKRMGGIAETGRDFAAIAEVEAQELMPLLALRAAVQRVLERAGGWSLTNHREKRASAAWLPPARVVAI
jgi:hypothetical protein